MEYVITFPDVWTALRFAQLYEDHLYKDENHADLVMYQNGYLTGEQYAYQRHYKIQRPIKSINEYNASTIYDTIGTVMKHRSMYHLNKVALIIKFTKKEFYRELIFNGLALVTDERHRYVTYAEYHGESFDMSNCGNFDFEQYFVELFGYRPPIRQECSIIQLLY